MKRLILFLLLMGFASVVLNAKDLTPLQKKAKTEIYKNIRKIVTNIQEIDDDCLSFEYDGKKYLIT